MTRPASLTELLDRLRPDDDSSEISVANILERIGQDSFAPIVLVPALLLVSPLSAIPGSPTLGAVMIVTLTVQWLWGRSHLWLPAFITRRAIPTAKLSRALSFLARPAAWLDRHSRPRLTFLVRPPISLLAKLLILAIALTWPVLELLPMVTSLGAATVALMAFGLMVRDGIFIVAGCVPIAVLFLVVYTLGSAA